MNNQNYPWTEAGRNLLMVINQRIEHYGGTEKLADAIEAEQLKVFTPATRDFRRQVFAPRPFTRREERYIAHNYEGMKSWQIALTLGRSLRSVECKVAGMIHKGIIKPKKSMSFSLNKVA
jgi:DNA-binding NarL/FixJ family response regulator